jgi:hypothetical protein
LKNIRQYLDFYVPFNNSGQSMPQIVVTEAALDAMAARGEFARLFELCATPAGAAAGVDVKRYAYSSGNEDEG